MTDDQWRRIASTGPAGPGATEHAVGQAPARSSKATVALILGAASLVTIPLVVAVIAIVVANRALEEIARTPGLGGGRRARVGRGLASAELVIVAVVVVVATAFGLAA